MGKRKRRKPLKCKITGCGEPRRAMGLCRACYDSAYRDVEIKKVTTWEQLIAEGKAVPKRIKLTPYRRSVQAKRKQSAS